MKQMRFDFMSPVSAVHGSGQFQPHPVVCSSYEAGYLSIKKISLHQVGAYVLRNDSIAVFEISIPVTSIPFSPKICAFRPYPIPAMSMFFYDFFYILPRPRLIFA
jgi:hypothetical protein